MEGVSYGSLGSAALVDLAGLNFAIRNVLIANKIDFTIVTPGQNKKFATGLGNAEKDLMIHSWLMIEKHLKDIKDIKIDDLADAYFLSNYYKQLTD
jgi:Holliday junction resolvasome RuvABC endonuclease subunit